MQEEPVPVQRPALIVLLAMQAAPGTVSLRLGRGTSGPFVCGMKRRPARLWRLIAAAPLSVGDVVLIVLDHVIGPAPAGRGQGAL